MKEEWKDIKGYEGKYQVNLYGDVKSLISGKTLTPKTNHNGYLRVGLGGYKSQKWFFVHRLVYEAFISPIPDGMQVNHINEIKTDNRPDNLNLMTPKENTNWGTGSDRCHRHKKRPVTQVLPDGTAFFTYFSASDAEADLGIPNSNINKCCKNKRETAGGFMWEYA